MAWDIAAQCHAKRRADAMWNGNHLVGYTCVVAGCMWSANHLFAQPSIGGKEESQAFGFRAHFPLLVHQPKRDGFVLFATGLSCS